MTAAWPVIWPESPEHDAATAEEIATAEEYAASTLRMLTLSRVGGLPVTVMPCAQTCKHPLRGGFSPQRINGKIVNCWCSRNCNCKWLPTVVLTAPVGRVDEVVVDGQVLDPTAYHVENGNELVRLDGGVWPSCSGEDFTVTYLNAYPVSNVGRRVGGILALEYLKAIRGTKCRLPSNVTTLSRQGVTMEIQAGMFPNGMTGLREVDAYLVQWNPHGIKTPPTVHSPDYRPHREVTWRA